MDIRSVSKEAISVVIQLPAELTGKIIKLALNALQHNIQDLSNATEKIQAESKLSRKQLLEVLSIYIEIIKLFSNSGNKEFTNILLAIGFPDDYISSLPFINNRKELIDKYFISRSTSFQNIASIKWRLDISLMTSIIGKDTAPNIMLCIKLTNGNLYIIQLNKNAFHNIRFNIALILKNMKSTNVTNKLVK
ncbi:COMM domain containing 5 Like Sm protein 4 [Rhynchophorus ferrugineus]|uniref:COMM domain-containing protein 5 n=1 Tax=Rhynchophorus ferrugineus TaxID=354439 RepID=A0A834IZA1_RHYFE|nr:hypothetical protein GWI33_002856 [Rhynchophorus ferrugineus]